MINEILPISLFVPNTTNAKRKQRSACTDEKNGRNWLAPVYKVPFETKPCYGVHTTRRDF
jgi:hypothetical protein